jgi:hypothetical protein
VVGVLADKAGLDRWRVLNRMSGYDMSYRGRNLGRLADEMRLDEEERRRLLRTFRFEEESLAD